MDRHRDSMKESAKGRFFEKKPSEKVTCPRQYFVFVDGNWYLVNGLCMWPLCGYTMCLQLQASSPAGGVDEEMGELPHYV